MLLPGPQSGPSINPHPEVLLRWWDGRGENGGTYEQRVEGGGRGGGGGGGWKGHNCVQHRAGVWWHPDASLRQPSESKGGR